MNFIYNKLSLLIIEDNLGDFILVKEYLEESFQTIEYEHALDYKSAEKLLRQSTSYDIIILDLILPDTSGTLFIQNVVNLSNQIPIIMITGSLNLKFCLESLEYGVSDYLFKDELNPNSLFKSINYSIEKQKRHLRLLESERKYKDLFNFSPAPMFVYETDNFKLLDANAAALEYYAYKRDEFLSMHLNQLFFKEDVEANMRSLKTTMTKDKDNFEMYLVFRGKLEKELKAEVKIKTIHFQNQNSKLLVVNDLTEQLLHNQALNQQNKKLKEIAWQQSHEMRSPASKILGIIELLKLKTCSPNEQILLINEIETSIKELDEVIRSISKKAKQVTTKKSNK